MLRLEESGSAGRSACCLEFASPRPLCAHTHMLHKDTLALTTVLGPRAHQPGQLQENTAPGSVAGLPLPLWSTRGRCCTAHGDPARKRSLRPLPLWLPGGPAPSPHSGWTLPVGCSAPGQPGLPAAWVILARNLSVNPRGERRRGWAVCLILFCLFTPWPPSSPPNLYLQGRWRRLGDFAVGKGTSHTPSRKPPCRAGEGDNGSPHCCLPVGQSQHRQLTWHPGILCAVLAHSLGR